MILWLGLTSIGDSIILMPAALMIALWLFADRNWKMAFLWCGLFGAAMIAVVLTKLAFIGWGIGSASLDFTGISGHAARAAAVFPVLFYFVLQRGRRKTLSYAVLSGWLLGLAVTVSRVIIGVHSVSEAVAGCILGTMASLVFMFVADSKNISMARIWLLTPSLIFFLATPYSKPAPTQQWLTTIALYLSGHERPFDRSMWRSHVDQDGALLRVDGAHLDE